MQGTVKPLEPEQPRDVTVTYRLDAEVMPDKSVEYFAVVSIDEGDVWGEDTIDITPRKWGHELFECARKLADNLDLTVREMNIIRDPEITLH